MLRRALLVLFFICCSTVLSDCAPTKDDLGRVLVESGAVGGAWSKDSRYLYYLTADEIRRYDTQTGEKQSYKVDDLPDAFDVSPDGKSIAFWRNLEGIYVTSLETGKKRRIYYSSRKEIHSLWWLPQNRLLFTQMRVPTEYRYDTERVRSDTYGVRNPAYDNLFLMSPDGKNMENVRSELFNVTCAADGSGFVYEGVDKRFHYFSLRTRKDRPLSFKEWKKYPDINFVYLSERQLVYYARVMQPDDIHWKTYTESVDLATMTITPFSLPARGLYMGVSPDLSKLWVVEPGGSDWYNASPSKLYLMDIPPSKAATTLVKPRSVK